MIDAESFPGWKDFAALVAHLKFVKGHHRNVEKIAAVSDSSFLAITPTIASHFVQAEVRHFGHSQNKEGASCFRTETTDAKPKRRWFSFSLRTCLVDRGYGITRSSTKAVGFRNQRRQAASADRLYRPLCLTSNRGEVGPTTRGRCHNRRCWGGILDTRVNERYSGFL